MKPFYSKKLNSTNKNVELTINFYPCYEDFKGHFEYKEDIANIIDSLNNHNGFGWCNVEVKARLINTRLSSSDYLGCVSCTDYVDFYNSGYLEDMIKTAENELKDEINKIKIIEFGL